MWQRDYKRHEQRHLQHQEGKHERVVKSHFGVCGMQSPENEKSIEAIEYVMSCSEIRRGNLRYERQWKSTTCQKWVESAHVDKAGLQLQIRSSRPCSRLFVWYQRLTSLLEKWLLFGLLWTFAPRNGRQCLLSLSSGKLKYRPNIFEKLRCYLQ